MKARFKKFITLGIIFALTTFLTSSFTIAATDSVTATVLAQNVAVSLNQSSFDYGTVPINTASSTLNLWAGAGITATNDGNITAGLTINGANTTGAGTTWTLDSANSTQDHYIHKFCNDTDNICTSPPTNFTALTTSPQTLKASVAAQGTVVFQLQLTTPQTVADYNQQSAAVTITISAS